MGERVRCESEGTRRALRRGKSLRPLRGWCAVVLGLAWRVEPGASPTPGDNLAVGLYDQAGALRATPLTLNAASPPGAWHTWCRGGS